jgi:penicillin-binding protein 2
MLNQPQQLLLRPTSRPRPSIIGVRLASLFLVFALPLAAVAARVWYLQAVAAGRFETNWDKLQTETEEIPAQDGRILSADGLALAYDRTRFEVAVHYRWIEATPNPAWLREQARARLAPRDRRDSRKLAAAEAEVRRLRDDFWQALAIETASADLDQFRRRIEQRIARMKVSVERSRQDRRDEALRLAADLPQESGTWKSLWIALVRELTTAPTRETIEPIILKEELDYHALLKDVPLAAAVTIQSSPATFPTQAVQVRTTSDRVYPAGNFAAHVVGARRWMTDDQATPQIGATSTVREGISGIEQAYDPVLRGRPGLKRVVYNRRREIVSNEVIRQPVNGSDVTLTFDSILQAAAERILDEALASSHVPDSDRPDDSQEPAEPTAVPQGATLIAMDINSGDVLAAACAPRFDLSLYTDFDREKWDAAMADPRHPFFSRITALSAPPGSIFKVLTAVAALESGAIDGETPLHCQGYLDRPDQLRCMIYRQRGGSHGDVNLPDALCQSCNVYFFQAARQMRPQEFRTWIERFGFGAPTGIDLAGESAGRVPGLSGGSPAGRPRRGSDPQLAIGQSSLLVSPLQVARMMAAIANGGFLVQPRLGRPPQEKSAGGRDQLILASAETASAAPPRKIPDLSPRTLSIVREGLERVVNDPRGTGKSVRMTGVRIAGKTGTAETSGDQPDHAWFAGYVPADRPRIAFVVMLEHAGSGGQAAGPVARKFVEALIESGRVRSTESAAAVPRIADLQPGSERAKQHTPGQRPGTPVTLESEQP